MGKATFLFLSLLCLLSSVCFAGSTNHVNIAFVPSVGGECSPVSGYELYWDGDHSSGTTYACLASGTLNGTLLGATINTDAPGEATNAINCFNTNDYIRWSCASASFSASEGLVKIDIYLTGSTGNNNFFEADQTANNDLITARIGSDNLVYFIHEGQNIRVNVTSTNTVPDTTWTTVQLRWSVTNNQVAVKVGANDWEVDVDEVDDVTAWTSAITTETFAVGEDVMGDVSDTFHMDNFYMDNDSGL